MHRLAVCALAVVSAVKQRGPQATRGTTVTEQCEACSLAVMSARNTVMKAVHKGAKKAAPPTKARWKEILAAGCREKGRACELFMRAAGGEIADELGEIVAEGAPSAGAELETHVLQKSLCAELTEACPEAHVFRRQPDALDVEFANRAGVALEVYWVKDGAPADAKPDELTVALGDGQSSTHDSYPRHRWAFLRPDDPWEHAGRLDLPPRPLEQRYVITANGGFDPEMQATIVDPSAVRPATWDDEEDGAWEPNTIPNPEFRTNQMYHVRLLEPDEELPAAGGGRREL